MYKISLFALCGFLLCLVTGTANAQLAIPAHVVGNGNTTASDGGLKIAATVGQAVVSTTATTDLRVKSGFWTTRTIAQVTNTESLPSGESLSWGLHQNYPNPFSRETAFTFTIAEPTQVRLELYDVLGRRVDTIANQMMASGAYEILYDATHLSGGVYLYVLQTAETTLTGRMNVIK